MSVLFVPVTLRCDGCDQTMTVNRAAVAATRSYALIHPEGACDR